MWILRKLWNKCNVLKTKVFLQPINKNTNFCKSCHLLLLLDLLILPTNTMSNLSPYPALINMVVNPPQVIIGTHLPIHVVNATDVKIQNHGFVLRVRSQKLAVCLGTVAKHPVKNTISILTSVVIAIVCHHNFLPINQICH